jgi:hypothetical protein
VARALRTNLGKVKQMRWYKMGMAKSHDYVPDSDYCEPGFAEPKNTKRVVLQSAEQMELEVLLEELAEFIESEDGILIP